MPTYLQLVQQVEHALRLGYLKPGDQLPRVRDVVSGLAINPNTVLKAYRELETKGLAVGRPGQGTFVRATLSQVALPELGTPRRSLLGWLATADSSGLDEDGMVALFTSVLRDCTLDVPAGHLAALVGPNGAVKTTLMNLVAGLAEPSAGGATVLGGQPTGSPVALDGIAFVGQDVLTATVFDARGIAFAAWTLAGFSLGVLAGMFIRRIVPAMAITLGVYLGLMLLTWGFLRKLYLPSMVTSSPRLFSGSITPNSPWVLSTWHAGGTQWWRYIPVSRFWPMQLIEGGWLLLLLLSVLLIAATVWLVRHRAA